MLVGGYVARGAVAASANYVSPTVARSDQWKDGRLIATARYFKLVGSLTQRPVRTDMAYP